MQPSADGRYVAFVSEAALVDSDTNRFAVQRKKLHFKGFALFVDKNDRADIARV
jgi:hypothetical protein